MRHRPLLVWAAAFAVGIGMGASGGLASFARCSVGLAALGLIAAGIRPKVPALFIAGLGICWASAPGTLRLAAFGQVAPSDVSHWADRTAPVTLDRNNYQRPGSAAGRADHVFPASRAVCRCGRQASAVTGDVSVALGPERGVGRVGGLRRPGGAGRDIGDAARRDQPRRIFVARLSGPAGHLL